MRCRFVAVLLFPLLASSCLELEQTIEIRPDGSGVLSLELQCERKILDDLVERYPIVTPIGPLTDGILGEVRLKNWLAKRGLRMRRFTRRQTGSRVSVELAIEFDDVTALGRLWRAKFIGVSSTRHPNVQAWIVRGEAGAARLVFYPAGRALHESMQRRPKRATRERAAEQKAALERMRAAWKGLRVTYRFRLPGKVLATKGLARVGEREARFVLTEASFRTTRDLVALAGSRFSVDFDASSLQRKPRRREPSDRELAEERKKR